MIDRRFENGFCRHIVPMLGLAFFLFCVMATLPSQAEAQARSARVHLEFEPGDDGSVLIVRSDRPIQYQTIEESHSRIVLEIANARPRSPNDLNPLVTKFFTTAVEEAKLESLWQGGRPIVRLVVDLSEAAPHRVSMAEDGIRVRVSPPRGS